LICELTICELTICKADLHTRANAPKVSRIFWSQCRRLLYLPIGFVRVPDFHWFGRFKVWGTSVNKAESRSGCRWQGRMPLWSV